MWAGREKSDLGEKQKAIEIRFKLVLLARGSLKPTALTSGILLMILPVPFHGNKPQQHHVSTVTLRTEPSYRGAPCLLRITAVVWMHFVPLCTPTICLRDAHPLLPARAKGKGKDASLHATS